MADDPFAFSSGTLTIGTGERRATMPLNSIAGDFRPSVTFTRSSEWPASFEAGRLAFEGTLTGVLDPLGGIRDMRCPGCGLPWVELEPGHSWSSAHGHCWTETGPIDEYGQPLEEGSV